MILNLYAPAPQSTHMSMTIISFNIFSLMMMILFSQWHRLQLNTEFLFQESNLWPSRNYSGGQKCWDLSINTSKNSDLLPPSSKNVKCWAKWAEINSFLGATLLGGGGGRGGGMKGWTRSRWKKKLLLRGYSCATITWECFSTMSQSVLTSIVV